MNVVSRYLAEVQGPPPREPLRFWIGGEWVEMSPPEPDPVVHAGAVHGVPWKLLQTPAPAEPEPEPEARPAAVEAVAAPEAAPEPEPVEHAGAV